MSDSILVVRRSIRAGPERIFDAWTDRVLLASWWGPEGVTCVGAEIDARVGGTYRIDNQMPDGSRIVIRGEYLEVDRPWRLRFTWTTGGPAEEVEVVLRPVSPEVTEVIVSHSRISSAVARKGHESGWIACLRGLDNAVASTADRP